ncbi:acetate/propionate family kinase [Denitromonas iodatirespirans]|uniref:Acetate kinase n=1 Tax=Denitromonas iodatirespirans TaxID=2795389 RepID=A0A944DCV6_DENI1|nr:acetate/propionate family kinase [Denitromonas iodatirespirans]MBT0962736.1 acetate/propionate family kinase [Denitromonas iodatirespirans]
MKALWVLNAGSSSLKFALYPVEPGLADTPALAGQIEAIGSQPRLHARAAAGERFEADVPQPADDDQDAHHQSALDFLLDWMKTHTPRLDLIGVGHRVVHGGAKHSAPLLLDDTLVDALAEFEPLAPLHQPHNLRAVRAVARLMPQLPQVACFDTAFHRSQPPLAQRFALPRALHDEGVRRYGFHGLSYEYIARQLPQAIGAERARGAVIVAHLGNGASMCALRDGQSVASSMGFTAIDGLMMGTRSGSLDPGVLLYLMDRKHMDSAALSRLLYKESGLLGVSGISADMRDLLASPAPEAREAVELFCYRAARELGSLAAAAGGCDALVFTGGIGEHAAAVREGIVTRSAWLGLALDAEANTAHAERIDRAGSPVAIAVVPTNEEWMIARHALDMIGA